MRLSKLGAVCALVGLFVTGSVGGAQGQMMPVGDPVEDYLRVLQLVGKAPVHSWNVRPLPAEVVLSGISEAHPWDRHVSPWRAQRGLVRMGVLPVAVGHYLNTERPVGQNDGAVWQGRGHTVAGSAGVFGQIGLLSIAVRPLAIYTQNTEFDLSTLPSTAYRRNNLSPYSYPFHGMSIDMPQQFGPESYWTFDPGQSYARLDWQGVAAGISTENMWWGPATENAIVMSNHAGGFPHAFLGTSGPANVGIGRLNLRWVWGWLYESGYFDYNEENDRRYFTGAALDFSPMFAPGLSIGATRSFIQNTELSEPTVGDLLHVVGGLFKERASDIDPYDQMASVFARWVFPESGFEFYGEWARGDHSSNLRDVFNEPEHGSAFTLGAQKAFSVNDRHILRLKGEWTNLQAARPTLVRSHDAGFFYVHSRIRQGYTQRGQVMGAGIGPGSNSQSVGADLFAPWGKVGFSVQRVVFNNDRYFFYNDETDNFWSHEVELSAGAHARVFVLGFELGAEATYGHLYNRDYVYGDNIPNLNVHFSVRRSISGLW